MKGMVAVSKMSLVSTTCWAEMGTGAETEERGCKDREGGRGGRMGCCQGADGREEKRGSWMDFATKDRQRRDVGLWVAVQ